MDDLLEGFLNLSREGDAPLTSQLAGQLRSLISHGRLKAGDRLPSSRALAARLGVSRNTVTYAIEQLVAEGYLDASQSRRPVVASGAALLTARRPDATVSDTILQRQFSAWAQQLAGSNWPPLYRGRPRPFQPGLADEREFPRDVWGRCLRQAASRRLRWDDPSCNDPALQEALLNHLAAHRGVSAGAGQIIILPSAQAGLALIARVMINAGDVTWIESPGYGGAYAAASAAGANIVGVPVDGDGLTIAAETQAPKLIFVTPSHQYPTGGLMPIGRRLELLRFAANVGAAIVEDDYDGEFHYEGRPVAALAAIDPDASVFYVGTFSKAMSADIRVGYVVAPEAMIPTFELAQRHLGLLAPATVQAALAEFIERGAYLAHVRRMTRLYRERRDCLIRVLAEEMGDRLAIETPAGGMQLLVRYTGPTDDEHLSRRILESGVLARPLSEMLHHRSQERGLFLGFAAWTNAELTDGAKLIARCIL